MAANTTELEKRLWDAADQLRANSDLKSHEYSVPVLGLIFLRYADHKFTKAKAKFTSTGGSGRRTIGKADYQAQGVLYLPENAQFSKLLDLPEGADIAKAINDAMRAIEADNEDLKGVLPKTYTKLDKTLLVSLLKSFAAVPMDIEGDAFGKISRWPAPGEQVNGSEFVDPCESVLSELIGIDSSTGAVKPRTPAGRYTSLHLNLDREFLRVWRAGKQDLEQRLVEVDALVADLETDAQLFGLPLGQRLVDKLKARPRTPKSQARRLVRRLVVAARLGQWPSCSRNRSASIAAMQPAPAAVIAWR
jgi:hypothetical protein